MADPWQMAADFQKIMLDAATKADKRTLGGARLAAEPTKVELGQTPADVVYEEDQVKLLRYHPVSEKLHSTPLLIVYALINRFHILDLQPDRSVVGNLLSQGFDIHIIDWGTPRPRDRYLTLGDYVNGYLHNCVEHIKRQKNVNSISLLGYCMGGTLSAMYASLHQRNIRNLIVQAAPFDFKNDSGLLNIWAQYLNANKLVDTFGNIPGEFLNWGFLMLNPVRLIVDKYFNFFENTDDREFVENFLRMEKWIFDSPPVAGETFKQFIVDLYQKNLLVKNQFYLDGRRVDLKKIISPVLNLIADKDHLVPPESSLPLNDAIGSQDKIVMRFPTGHVGLCVSSRAKNEIWPKVGAWLAERSK